MPSSTLEEVYGFSVIIQSRLEYRGDAGPVTHAEARELGSRFSEHAKGLFEERTGAKVEIRTVRARSGSASIDQIGDFVFERVEDWQKWMHFFFNMSDEVEAWLEDEWRIQEGRYLESVVVHVTPRRRGSAGQRERASLPPNYQEILKEHRRKFMLFIWTFLGLGLLSGLIGALALFSYLEVRRDLDELRRSATSAPATASPSQAIVAYPPYPPTAPPPVTVREREAPCPDCPVIRRVQR